ncbi:hypothetical protein B0H10DRAFT_1397621 [Mycena sp. CBHHK59/15]|nr:hypothetical protein B0H10DRAFT_1397621 [Mycena sp. CBHHK59/15]
MCIVVAGEVVGGDEDEAKTSAPTDLWAIRGTTTALITAPIMDQIVILLHPREMCPLHILVREIITKSRYSRFEPEPPPHRRLNYADNEGYPSQAPPPLSREATQTTPVTPAWEYNDSHRERSERHSRRPEDGPVPEESVRSERERERERERFQAGDEEPTRVRGSLEGRLGPTYNDRHVAHQETRPTNHPLPLNPSLRRDNREAHPSEEPRSSTSQTQPGEGEHDIGWGKAMMLESLQPRRPPPGGLVKRVPRQQVEPQSQGDNALFDRVGGYDDRGSARSKIIRIRRPDSTSSLDNNSALPLDAPSASSSQYRPPDDNPPDHLQRPSGPPRSVSLLDRIGGEGSGDAMGSFEETPSLRDRVQIPSKRDWDDIGGNDLSPDAYGPDGYFDDDDLAAKRRKKNGKPKRGRRGGPP